MRVCGDPREAGGPGRHDHVCLAFDTFDEVENAVADFIAAGLAAGLRVDYVARDSPAAGLAALREWLPDADLQIASGALCIGDGNDVFGGGDRRVDPDDLVAAHARELERARADGFEGYRCVADVTALVVTSDQRVAFARYEHLVDRLMAHNPISGMCLFDRALLGAEAVAEFACLHPLHTGHDAPFALYATEDGLGLWGELDHSTADGLNRALACVADPLDGRRVRVDASSLAFVDHRSLTALDRYGAMCGGDIVLRNAQPQARRLLDLLDLEHVQAA